MRLFNIDEYTLPSDEKVDLQKTKELVGIFLMTYKTNRERLGMSIYPKLTQESYLIDNSDWIKNKLNEGHELTLYEKEYLKTEQCFVHGFTAIMHPFKPEVTERRRRIFFYRYLYGLSVPLVSERINYQKNIIVDESKLAILQFSLATDLIVFK